MIPARDRQLRLTIYNTQADMEADTNGTSITSGIYENSARLDHTFFTALPGWGEANASMFTCELDDAPDLTGKYIRGRVAAYATDAATARTTYRVFAGKINSCKYDRYKASRTLEAYDRLYELRKVDISQWWNTWVQTLTATTVTIATALDAMCVQYGVTNSASLPGYSTTTAPLKARKLGACSFVQMLGYIGEICGGYFTMRDGPLRFVDMRNVNGTAAQESADGNIDSQMTEIDDADTEPYTQVTIYEGSDIVYSNGSGKNLAITDNPFLIGQPSATVNSWGQNIYQNATRIAGRPATLELVYSQPQAAWSRITSATPFILTTTDEGTTRRHIVSGYSMSGSGLIDETITCTGEMREGASYSAQQNAMLSELTNIGTQLTFKVNADAVIEAVNLEAQGGVQINAEALNINGVQSTGGKLKVGVNGDVEVNGKITTSEGSIGGWTIGADSIYKTVTIGAYEYMVALNIVANANENSNAISIRRRPAGSTGSWTTISGMLYGGKLYSILADINGKIVSTEGSIGGWEISENALTSKIGNNIVAEIVRPTSNDEGYISLKSADRNEAVEINPFYLYLTNNASGTYMEIDNGYGGSDPAFRIYNNTGQMYLYKNYLSFEESGRGATEIGFDRLTVNDHDLLQMTPHFAQMFATAIASGENLNSTTYLAPGQYYTPTSAIAASLVNSPTSTAFNMTVEAPISAAYGNEGSSGEAFRIRKMTVLGGEQWVQYCYKTTTTWTYGAWQRIAAGVTKDTYTNTSVKAGSLTARRNGNVVAIISTGNAVSVPAGSWKNYVTLAAQYRPSEEINAPVTNAYGDVKTVRIRTNGNVDLYSATAITSASNFSFNVTYIVD